ncbi:molybdenum ABC transporter ATP-binding protein [Limibacillus halophilus]|uniref:Molybdate transport system ATP-binding protein n=1 Tax=Limibacillus halophilus TaxID=1579333 RepID=A0A839SWT0_9PROT|nr:molybdenum ABC transporter ATP-binding protein [Limibacillus halophilus]MBB3065403.1 molybdate transport system ATP-binding protein [Limibacillus halophilus]
MILEVSFELDRRGFPLSIDFAAEARGITAIFGPSGAGKTTLINVIAGLIRPDKGKICLAGETLYDSETKLYVPTRGRRIGYVFQDGRLFPHLKVRDNLLYGWRRRGKPVPEHEIDKIVELLGIGSLLMRRPAGLSGGERQRVALGRALLSGPKLLLLDEPLAALDHSRKEEILPYLEGLRDEARVPILVVSHSIEEVTRLADNMVLLNNGKVAASGSVSGIMSRLDLFPLTGRFEAGAVIDCLIERQDSAFNLTELRFDHGSLTVPGLQGRPGDSVRVRIRARDIILALAPLSEVSANNQIAAKVVEIRQDPGPYVDVSLGCGNTTLLARVTRKSKERLNLRPGLDIFAVVKSVTVERRGGRSARPAPASTPTDA